MTTIDINEAVAALGALVEATSAVRFTRSPFCVMAALPPDWRQTRRSAMALREACSRWKMARRPRMLRWWAGCSTLMKADSR